MGGGGGHRPGQRRLPRKPKLDAPRNDINVTPLVDVCLVLLIIFMVITPLMARGKEVKLPETEHHSEEKDKLQPVISVGFHAKTKEETVWLAGSDAKGKNELIEVGRLSEFRVYEVGEQEGEVMDSALRDTLAREVERLWEIAKSDESRNRIFLKVDQQIPYERVYPLLMAINADLNLSSIDLGTAERRP
jgi:biopolymer transport protein ExbD